jgi:predicted ester cyclase
VLAARTWEAVEAGRIDDLDDLFSPDVEFSVSAAAGRGLAHVRAVFTRHHEGYPDLRHEVLDAVESAGGDAVALRLAFSATHVRELRGPFGPIPPSGRTLRWGSSDHVRAERGRIVAWHAHFDRLALLEQLGQVASLAAAGTADRRRAIARRVLREAFEEGRIEVLREAMTADFVNHRRPAGADAGIEGLERIVRAQRAAFPDLRHVVEREVVEGDLVALLTWVEATHSGPIHGVAATGRRVRWRQVHVLRMAGDRIAEHWGVSDLASLWVQIGRSAPVELE